MAHIPPTQPPKSAGAGAFKPALIVVDVQEDFCPPNGSLAVPDGRDIIRSINKLLALPFAFKVATKDWHPADHISFASNHKGKKPLEDFTTVINPQNPSESYETRLWPVHCVQGSPGAELLPELDVANVDRVVEKGQNKSVEMYSVFYAPFKSPRVADSGLSALLTEHGITHVYVVGLAADYCVKATAVDAHAEGFATYLVEEATRPVDVEKWAEVKKEIEATGVRIVGIDGPEVRRVTGG